MGEPPRMTIIPATELAAQDMKDRISKLETKVAKLQLEVQTWTMWALTREHGMATPGFLDPPDN